jgi:multicomponent K+:H+ antiporter subunit A/multicomponent Na+:H+ antiporter subunit A
MTSLPLFAVFTPLVAALLAPLVAKPLGARAGLVLALAFAPALALLSLVEAARTLPVASSLPWVPAIGLEIALRADGFSLLFAVLVAGVGVLVMAYASAYLGRGERFGRFYSYLLLFGGSMLGLVLADNLIALFAFWELTSITSFLLIGFWHERPASQDGALKALFVTASGGLALLVGVILLALGGESLLLSELNAEALRSSPYFLPAMMLLILAAFTKSAQLPFHLWLPTAMEAPTPVSAYLHSATMVKAGVVLLAKFGFLFVATALSDLIMWVGLVTMVWGSYLALKQTDLKALLAYSTVSQLGLLTSLYGAGAPFAGTAHLINHAAFKAALFLVVGIIDHETKSRNIHGLSGLGTRLPITFLLALPAALSMAGLPPLGGFISKELFYEAMLERGPLPIFLAVFGSVMTFAYALRFLKVFVGSYRSPNPDTHEAPLRLWWPLLPLSAATLLFGVLPGSAAWFTDLAAPALGYAPYPLELWHGVNAALILSVVTWLLGIALYLFLPTFLRLQRALTPAWNANTVFYGLLAGLERLAAAVTARTQDASFAAHLRLIFLPLAVAGVWLWGRFLPAGLSAVPLEFWVVAALIVSASVGVLLAKSRLSALILMGLAGFGLTVAFVLLGAPDLALTQLLIETVSIILFLSVFRYLPALSRYYRSRRRAAADGLLAAAVGVTVFTALLAVQLPLGARIKDYFLSQSYELGGGLNVVNVLLVDFRGYDTMGEIVVLAIVGVAIFSLLRLRARTPPLTVPGRGRWGAASSRPEIFFSTLAKPIVYGLIAIAIHFFLRGHNAPGGGFIAGLVVAVAALLYRMALRERLLNFPPRLLIPWGLLLAMLTGAVPLLLGEAFLKSAYGYLTWPLIGEFEWATAVVFDLGVLLVVVGGTLTIIDVLAERVRGVPVHREPLGPRKP